MQTTHVPMAELMKVVRLQLETAGRANLAVTGFSMLPMLRQYRDSVILAPITDCLKSGDIALFQREDGRYVLHRVIAVELEAYIFCGDNQAQRERVGEQQLVARVTGYVRKGKEYGLNSLGYRLYCWACVRLFCVRKYYIALRRRLGRLRSRLSNQEEFTLWKRRK